MKGIDQFGNTTDRDTSGGEEALSILSAFGRQAPPNRCALRCALTRVVVKFRRGEFSSLRRVKSLDVRRSEASGGIGAGGEGGIRTLG